MIRKLAVAALIAAFMSTSTPAEACTGISLDAKDGTAVRGRTMEFGFPLSSNVIVIPAGTPMSGTLPDGGKGIQYTTKYAMAGANAVGQTVVIDGINDQGLSFGLFYFPGFAVYPAATAENASRAMAPFEFGAWVLGNFATVDEVKTGLKDAVIVPTPAPKFGQSPSHYFLRDKTGKSIVIEPLEGTLKVFDAPLGVVTNAPAFDWYMINLRKRNLRWYFRTYDDETIRMIDLGKAVSAAGGKIRMIKMESKQPIVDASDSFMDGAPPE